MENYDTEREHGEHDLAAAVGFLAGVLIGGLAGAGTMLLLAPRSGKQTRERLQHKRLELQQQAADGTKNAVEQAQNASHHITFRLNQQADKIQHQADKIQQRGQELIEAQKERWLPVVEAGKTAVQGA